MLEYENRVPGANRSVDAFHAAQQFVDGPRRLASRDSPMVVGIGAVVREARRMLQKMTKRIWCTRNWRVEIKLAAIDQNECSGCRTVFAKLHQGTSGCDSGFSVASGGDRSHRHLDSI